MAFNFREGGGGNDPDIMLDINTTPLIDVMLVLLVMLIITIPIQTHEVKLDLPQPNTPAPAVPPQVVDIDIDFDGTITWNGQAVPDRRDLESRLLQASVLADQPEIHLRPNKLAPYKTVAEVLASAQRIGVTKIGLVGNEQFLPN